MWELTRAGTGIRIASKLGGAANPYLLGSLVMNNEIRALSVLPANRIDIELKTADGLTLVGELALPEGRPPVATLVMLHPLPTHGGYMDSHVYRKAAWRLPELADIAVLRFNTRGTSSARGTSQGDFGEGISEVHDVNAAMDFVRNAGLPNPWLVGWSFGTELALMHGIDPDVRGAILLSPPLHRAKEEHLEAWGHFGRPVLALIPEHDDYLKPDEAKQRFAALGQAQIVPVAGAKHLWVGETYVTRVLNEIVSFVRPQDPQLVPLPTHWAGPMETAAPTTTDEDV